MKQHGWTTHDKLLFVKMAHKTSAIKTQLFSTYPMKMNVHNVWLLVSLFQTTLATLGKKDRIMQDNSPIVPLLIKDLEEATTGLDPEKPLTVRQAIILRNRLINNQPKPPILSRATTADDIDYMHRWCVDHMLMDGVALRNTTDMGLGVVATQDLEAGDVVMLLAPEDMIAVHLHDPSLACAVPAFAAYHKSGTIDDLTLHLLVVKLLGIVLNPSAELRPFVRTLPRHFMHTLFFSADEFDILRSSVMYRTTVYSLEDMLTQYTQFYDFLHADPECALSAFGISGRYADSLALYRWVYALVLSRNVKPYIRDDPDDTVDDVKDRSILRVLLPCWELINHSNDHTTKAHVIKYDNVVISEMTVPVKRGEQIFNNYSPPLLNSREAFVTYGFALIDTLKIDLTRPLDNQRYMLMLKRPTKDDNSVLYYADITWKDIYDFYEEYYENGLTECYMVAFMKVDGRLVEYSAELRNGLKAAHEAAIQTMQLNLLIDEMEAELAFVEEISWYLRRPVLLKKK